MTTRQIVRRWSRGRCHVGTIHPQLGMLWRGTVYHQRGQWILHDGETYLNARLTGDYLDAEAALLAATAWADEVLSPEQLAEIAEED